MLPGGWEEADRSRPLWESSWHRFIPRKVLTNWVLVCPALKMVQESKLGWIEWEHDCQNRNKSSINGIHTALPEKPQVTPHQ